MTIMHAVTPMLTCDSSGHATALVSGQNFEIQMCRYHMTLTWIAVFTRLQAPSELTPTSSRGLDTKEKSAIKRLSRIEAWLTKTSKFTQIEA